jgi:hypothetical protein
MREKRVLDNCFPRSSVLAGRSMGFEGDVEIVAPSIRIGEASGVRGSSRVVVEGVSSESEDEKAWSARI